MNASKNVGSKKRLKSPYTGIEISKEMIAAGELANKGDNERTRKTQDRIKRRDTRRKLPGRLLFLLIVLSLTLTLTRSTFHRAVKTDRLPCSLVLPRYARARAPMRAGFFSVASRGHLRIRGENAGAD